VSDVCKTLIISLGNVVGFSDDDDYVMTKHFRESDVAATEV
jgi:hypothetical protein